MTAAPVLDATGVAKRYGAVAALRDASLSVLPGEVHALMGANGAGKSTLVKILTGAVRPDSGTILVRGQPRDIRSPASARRAGLVPVYQEPALIPDLDVAAEPPPHRHAGRALPRLDARPRRPRPRPLADLARDLPLAVQRVLDLARALAHEPDVLILDEMTAALPADLAERVLDVVRAPGPRPAAPSSSSPTASSRSPPSATAPPCSATARPSASLPIAPGVEDRIVELMLGARVERARAAPPAPRRRPRPPARPASPPATSASAPASRTSRFELRDGEVVGVVALEGQGQDELFAALSGAIRPAAGTIDVDGTPVAFAHPADAIRARHRPRPRRPRRGPAHAALRPREHRAPLQRPPARLGPDRPPPRGRRRHRRHRPPADRHPRASARSSACPAATSRR